MSENIFSNETERITFTTNGIIYENLNEERYLNTISEARIFAETKLSNMGLNMNLDYIRNTPNGFTLYYRGQYLNETIYSNNMILKVSYGNLHSIEFNYIPIISFFGPERSLRPLDEVLLNFMRLHNAHTILSIDIVYDLLSDEIAMPFFRINFEYNGYEKSALINAY
jgi:hypothetical protein